MLTIKRVKKDDEGLYECLASNGEGSVKASAVVTVVGESLLYLHHNELDENPCHPDNEVQ